VSSKDKRDRLDKLEGKHNLSQAERDAANLRKEVRAAAEHANRIRDSGEDPPFTILSGGEVYCTADGKPVRHRHQVAAEQFYQKELTRGGPGLIHDPTKEVFYSAEGEFALSRDHVNLERLLGDARMRAWKAEDERNTPEPADPSDPGTIGSE
jgi:hypothetical protein